MVEGTPDIDGGLDADLEELIRPDERMTLQIALVGGVAGMVAPTLLYNLRDFEFFYELVPSLSISGREQLGFICATVMLVAFAFAARPMARCASSKERPYFATVGMSAICAMLAGCVVGVLAEDRRGVAVLLGIVLALMTAPAIALLVRIARAAQGARRGSLIHSAHRRSLWLASGTFAVAAVVPFTYPLDYEIRWDYVFEFSDLRLWMSWAAGAGLTSIALVAIFHIKSMLSLRRLSDRFDGARAATALPEQLGAVEIHDIGLGEDAVEQVALSSSAYRGMDRVHAVCRGDFARASRLLRLAIGLALTAGAVAAVLLHL